MAASGLCDSRQHGFQNTPNGNSLRQMIRDPDFAQKCGREGYCDARQQHQKPEGPHQGKHREGILGLSVAVVLVLALVVALVLARDRQLVRVQALALVSVALV
jgi:hypothetical protein